MSCYWIKYTTAMFIPVMLFQPLVFIPLQLILKKLKARQSARKTLKSHLISFSHLNNPPHHSCPSLKSSGSLFLLKGNDVYSFLPIRRLFHQESGQRSGRCSVSWTAPTAGLLRSAPGREICQMFIHLHIQSIKDALTFSLSTSCTHIKAEWMFYWLLAR